MERLTTEKYPFLEESVISALDQHKLFTARDFISCPTQKIAKITNLLFKVSSIMIFTYFTKECYRKFLILKGK